jgi:hypothetical protein
MGLAMCKRLIAAGYEGKRAFCQQLFVCVCVYMCVLVCIHVCACVYMCVYACALTSILSLAAYR